MRKNIKTLILGLGMAILFTAGSTYALAYWTNQDNTNFVVLQNGFTDNENVKVSRFVDGKNTCYLADSRAPLSPNSSASVSLSCFPTSK